MLKLFSAFRKNKIWDFNGGIHPPEMKTQSNDTPLRQVPLAQRFVIPLKQHINTKNKLYININNKILHNQPLTHNHNKILPIHTPTSNTITTITPHSTTHPSTLTKLNIIINTNNKNY